MATTTRTTTDRIAVGIGQAAVASEPNQITTILGSCIAITMYAPQARLGMLSHVVLPRSTGATAYPAKFADTAVTHMISVLEGRGIPTRKIVAKIAGGACMFGDAKFLQIGDSNVQAAVEALNNAGVCIAAQDVGGKLGRRVSFNLSDGTLTVECIGHPSHTI